MVGEKKKMCISRFLEALSVFPCFWVHCQKKQGDLSLPETTVPSVRPE